LKNDDVGIDGLVRREIPEPPPPEVWACGVFVDTGW
jgi:hypothetical protein